MTALLAGVIIFHLMVNKQEYSMELYIGLGITLIAVWGIWQQYKDDYNDFFKFQMLIKILKGIKNAVDPNYWAERIGEKSGLYDKARNSKTRQWVDSLEGWKWWAWQLGGGLIGVIIVEYLLNMVGMTMLPWK